MYLKLAPELAYHVMTGGPVINLASQSAEGVSDVMTAAWNCPFDTAEMLAVLDRGHTTSANILATGKYVISLPSLEQKALLLRAGSRHGRDCGDKFEALGIPAERSQLFGLKVIAGSLAYIECELCDRGLFAATGILRGTVKNLYVQEDMWNKQNDTFDPGCMHTVHHVSGEIFVSGGKIYGA